MDWHEGPSGVIFPLGRTPGRSTPASNRPPMSDIELRKRSATEIVDAAFQLYRRHALVYIMVTALAYAPWLVLNLILFRSISTPGTTPNFGFGRLAFVWFGNFITFTLMSGVLTKLVADAYLNGEPGRIEDAVRVVLPRVPALIGSAIGKLLLITLGFMLLIVPGIIFSLMFVATTAVIVLEGKGVIEAFGRSAQLTRNQKMHVFGTYLLIFVLYFLLSIGVVVLTGFLAFSAVIPQVVWTVFIILFYPIFGISEMLIYYDLRVRNEGYDVEILAGSLGERPVVG